MALQFFCTPAMPTQVTGSTGGAMARAIVKAKAKAKTSTKAAENFEPGLATAKVFEPSPPPDENLEPGLELAEVGAPASMPDQAPAFEGASILIGDREKSVNVSEQEIDMHSDDEGNLKNKFLINYKCKSCDEIFLNTNDAKGHSCEVESSALSDNLRNKTFADLDNSEHLEENDKSSKERKPKECSQCSKTFLTKSF